MMISPEYFYESELKGKSIEQIDKVIRSLKREMNSLKKDIETADEEAVVVMPSPEVRLKCTREYLDMARKAYAEAGGVYEPNQTEQRIIDFDLNLEYISKIKLTMSSFFTGQQTYTYLVEGDKVEWEFGGFSYSDFILPEETIKDKKILVEALREFHLGEWKCKYVDPYVLDGTQWELCIEYTNGRKALKYYGSNAFPFNFDEFVEFMGEIS